MRIEQLPRIEATVGSETAFDVLHVRPAETVTVLLAPIDELSLKLQAAGKKAGVNIPDIRVRVFTNPNTDSVHGTHFGTLSGAVKKAEKIRPRIFRP